jgi:hypothetical protein
LRLAPQGRHQGNSNTNASSNIKLKKRFNVLIWLTEKNQTPAFPGGVVSMNLPILQVLSTKLAGASYLGQ